MAQQYIPLLSNEYYHLFNRAIGQKKLFLSEDNYVYFLSKMKQHLLPVTDVFAYSLLPNHFHLLVRVKPSEELMMFYEQKKGKPFDEKEKSLPDFVMEQFSNWLNGYTKAFNKMYNRKGGLFIDYLKRTEAKEDVDITSFLFYIHKNAVHHGLTKKIAEWRYDSYNLILSDKPTSLQREAVINWFGSRDGFIEFHKQPVNLKKFDLE